MDFKKKLRRFVNRPAMNKTGLAEEIGISREHLSRIINSESPIPPSFKEKAFPVLIKYGWNKSQKDVE